MSSLAEQLQLMLTSAQDNIIAMMLILQVPAGCFAAHVGVIRLIVIEFVFSFLFLMVRTPWSPKDNLTVPHRSRSPAEIVGY